MYRPVLVTPPATLPVTRAQVKVQLDISHTEKDAMIDGLIAAAVSHLDGWTGILGRCLEEQTWRQDDDVFWRCFPLPLAPVISIVSVKYDDAGGAEQTVDSANYGLVTTHDGRSFVRMADGFALPALHAGNGPRVRVAYKAGYAQAGSPAASTVPDAIKQAMFLLVRHWFDNPSAVNVGNIVNAMPFAVDALLAPWRRVRF
jgi:uncharacterized phiE125 gp8 family phage protein